MSFSDLKKQSKLGSLTEKLVKEVEKMNSNGSSTDDRLWKATMDKSGIGAAIIRFLPAPDGEDYPWIKMFSHGFQGPGGWYIENSLTTIGKKDPVTEYNRVLWNTGNPKDQDTVRKQKRKLSYYSNIYVIKDPANPENEGKIFLFKYGKKIFDKILNAMQPEFEDEEPINPFDFWSGANFRLKIRKVDGYWNYDKSEFDSSSPLLNDDDAMEQIWKKQYSLSAIVAPDQFKTYEELEKRLNYVLGKSNNSSKVTNQEENEYDDYVQKESSEENVLKELEESYRKSKTNPVSTSNTSDDEDDEDDTLKYFQKLVDE